MPYGFQIGFGWYLVSVGRRSSIILRLVDMSFSVVPFFFYVTRV